MFELTINGVVYQFKFGMGFMREINQTLKQSDGDVKKNVGLRYALAGIIDGDMEDLVNVLYAANKGFTPRVTKALLDDYIDNECEDIDKVFEDVKDFLQKANATKKTMNQLLEMVEEQKTKAMK